MPALRRQVTPLPTEQALLPGASGAGDAGSGATASDGGPLPASVRADGGRTNRARGAGRFRLTIQEPTEAQVMRAVMTALRYHRAVAWVKRLSSGAGKLQYLDGSTSRWLRFGWIGAPDLIGQMKDGRLLAVEVKRPSGQVSSDQQAFIDLVRRFGGVAFIARRHEDVFAQLG